MVDQYLELADKTGIDFGAIIELMERLPIFLDGTAHKEARKKFAKIYSDTRLFQIANIDKATNAVISKIESRNGPFNLIEELAKPYWRAIETAIQKKLDYHIDPELIDEIPSLFDPTLSIRRRKILNNALDCAARDVPESVRIEFLDTIALLVLGVRPLTHSLALSLHKISETNDGKLFSEINFTENFSQSALTFVDRVSNAPVQIGSIGYAKDERFRCITVSEIYSEQDNQRNMFGFGGHVCIGRPISIEIWKKLTNAFAKLEKIIKKGTCNIESREPFEMVKSASIVVEDVRL